MVGAVSDVSNESSSYIMREMPLKLLFAFEHYYYLKNGIECDVLSYEESVTDLLTNL